MKKIHYDPKVDAAYIEIAKGKYEVSREISPSVIVDEDKNGKILGVEILDVSEVFVSLPCTHVIFSPMRLY